MTMIYSFERLKIDSRLQPSCHVRPGARDQAGRTAPGQWASVPGAGIGQHRSVTNGPGSRGRVPADAGVYLRDVSPSLHLGGGAQEGHTGKSGSGRPPAGPPPPTCAPLTSAAPSSHELGQASRRSLHEGKEGTRQVTPWEPHGTGAVVL